MNISNIVFPQQDRNGTLVVDEGYSLPVVITDVNSFSEFDLHYISIMKAVPPATRMRAGDLAVLQVVETALRKRFAREGRPIPRLWKVRHVMSKWGYMIYRLHQDGVIINGIDHAVALVEQQNLEPKDFASTLIYAHGYSHALFPNTATWFPSYALRKLVIREANDMWPSILDEAETEFTGFEGPSNLSLDLAPDLYALGKKLKRPFRNEEPTVHTVASMGLEELMMVPMAPTSERKKVRHEEDAYDFGGGAVQATKQMIPKSTSTERSMSSISDDLDWL